MDFSKDSIKDQITNFSNILEENYLLYNYTFGIHAIEFGNGDQFSILKDLTDKYRGNYYYAKNEKKLMLCAKLLNDYLKDRRYIDVTLRINILFQKKLNLKTIGYKILQINDECYEISFHQMGKFEKKKIILLAEGLFEEPLEQGNIPLIEGKYIIFN